MKQRMSMRQRQSLSFNARFAVALRLLQKPVSELNLELRDALESNPLLEESERPDAGDAAQAEMSSAPQDFEYPPDGSSGAIVDDDWTDAALAMSQHVTIRDHVKDQLALAALNDAQRPIAHVIVSAIDDRGYLNATVQDVLSALPAAAGADEETVEEVIGIIQQCEPCGVAARDLRECLALQIGRCDAPQAVCDAASELIESHMQALAHEQYEHIAEQMNISHRELDSAIEMIRSLNPNPGNGFGTPAAALVPDIVVSKGETGWQTHLNDGILPKLRISSEYRSMIDKGSRSRSNAYLEKCLQAAGVLLDNLNRRHVTLLRVAREVVRRQEQFLEHGERSMRPLTLSEIADTLNLSESTVSRACAGKFMMTPRGTYALKYFFPPKLRNDAGDGESALAIKQRIGALVGSESRSSPLSDQKMSDLLRDEGLHVARRTVAKYRTDLGIPPKRQRRITATA